MGQTRMRLEDRQTSESFKRRNPQFFGARPAAAATPTPATPQERRLRQSSKPRLNKLETDFLEQVLSPLRSQGVIVYEQSLRYEISTGAWYRPDFVSFPVGEKPTAWECKGDFAFKGAFEVLKSAARLYQAFTWKLVWRDKETGSWKEQLILP